MHLSLASYGPAPWTYSSRKVSGCANLERLHHGGRGVVVRPAAAELPVGVAAEGVQQAVGRQAQRVRVAAGARHHSLV